MWIPGTIFFTHKSKNMTVQEIKTTIDAGIEVYIGETKVYPGAYHVVKNGNEYLIHCYQNNRYGNLQGKGRLGDQLICDPNDVYSEKGVTVFTCDQCNEVKIQDNRLHNSCGTGYAGNDKGDKICYDCCGVNDHNFIANMKLGDKFTGYLTYTRLPNETKYHFGNWCSTFKVPIYGVKRGQWPNPSAHVQRTDFWFDYNGMEFWGRCIGDMERATIVRIKNY